MGGFKSSMQVPWGWTTSPAGYKVQYNKNAGAGHKAWGRGKSSKLHLEVFLLARSLVVQLSSMGPTSNLSPQEKSLGADISILGGNRTGIFVQWVKPGSQVEKAGLKEGCRLIEVGLGTG